MTIYVYTYDDAPRDTYCMTTIDPNGDLLQVIEAEPTKLPITENFKGEGVEIGEVFSCNSVVENLIRTK